MPLRLRLRHILIALAFGFVVNVLVIVLDWWIVDIGAVSRPNPVALSWDLGPSDTLFVHGKYHAKERALTAYSFYVFRVTTETEIVRIRDYFGYTYSEIEPGWVGQTLSRVLTPNSKAWTTSALDVVIAGNGWPMTCLSGSYTRSITNPFIDPKMIPLSSWGNSSRSGPRIVAGSAPTPVATTEWQIVPNSHRETTASGAVLRTHQNMHRLAYYPLLPGIVLNTLFYGLPSLLLVVMFLAVRFVLRARRNRCGWCAHQLIAENCGRCPECGNVSRYHFGYVEGTIFAS